MTELTLLRRKRIGQITPSKILLLVLLLAALSIVFFHWGKSILLHSAKEAYESRKEEAYQETYNSYVSMGEQAYHTSNRALISVNSAEEASELEVLTVSATVFVCDAKKTIWEEISGSSHFSVNLKAAEYIIDENRSTVYVRLPEPRLEETVSLDEDSIQIYVLQSDGKLSHTVQKITGSIQGGISESMNMRKEAANQILNDLQSDTDYPEVAKGSAKTMISALIRELNPTVSDLKIFVDFY